MKEYFAVMLLCILFFNIYAQSNEFFYGESKATPNLPNVLYQPGLGCREGSGQYCFLPTIISVNAPIGYEFIGEPLVNTAWDNQGSAGWNDLNGTGKERVEIITNTKLQKVARVWTSSWSFGVRLACKIQKIPEEIKDVRPNHSKGKKRGS